MYSPGSNEAITNQMMTSSDQNLDQSNKQGHMSTSFDVKNDSYEEFIQKIREMLKNSVSHGIFVLRPQQPETAKNALWLDIRLIAGEDIITLRLEQSNLFVRGYERTSSTDNFFWEFTDTKLINKSRDLKFTGSYVKGNNIVKVADVLREKLPLGGLQLEKAVRTLANLESPLDPNNQVAAYNLLILLQMIPEAVRFRTIAEHIATNYWDENGVRIDSRMVAMENGWGKLSTAVLRLGPDPAHDTQLPNIPVINPTNIHLFGQSVAALGILLITSKGRGPTVMMTNGDAYGRCLMNLEYVRVNDIDGENPGNLFGTVRVDDGWFTYTFYDRSSGDYEDVGPGGFATLTDPSQSYVVSGADAFVVSVDLFDQDSLSPNDKIAQGEIVWDRSVESVTFGNYDKHLEQVVKGDNGNVTVGYSALNSALGVTIQVR